VVTEAWQDKTRTINVLEEPRLANAKASGNPAKRAAAEKFEQTAGHRAVITWRDWVGAARIRTLPLAIAPIAAAAGIAVMLQSFSLLLTLLALAVAVLLQIGVNYANDYSDGIRGTDLNRVGPARLTASGLVNPTKVLSTALIFFALAAASGAVAVVLSERWWFLAIGAAAILAAWFYTGGKKPYGYMGLGELFVFVFFGPVATVGTVWLQSEIIPQEAWFASVGIGFYAVAVLLANNVRDRENDAEVGKRTLSVLIGDRASRILFAVLVLAPFAFVVAFGFFYPGLLYTWFLALLVVPTVIIMLFAKTAQELILVLKLTSIAGMLYGIGIGLGVGF
jgi:1,4-dihydroxy-2-naphthoate octaprenyltransferase